MKTILITGCSSGFGLATARQFLERDWKVIAAMRTPRADVLPRAPNLELLALDVTKAESISRAVDAVGPIDALVNNAGLGLLGVLEGTPMETARALFETNTFGPMALTRAFLPSFRARRAGVIVNVSSSTTLAPLPLLSTYTASKAALNAFTECLALELAPFGIRAHLVLPGMAPETAFGQNARAQMAAQGVSVPEAWADFTRRTLERMAARHEGPITTAADVAETIWRAVNDPASPLRLPAGADAVALSAL